MWFIKKAFLTMYLISSFLFIKAVDASTFDEPKAPPVKAPLASDGFERDNSTLSLSLNESIAIAFKNNRTIQEAYLGRVSDALSLEIAKGEFHPKLNVATSAQSSRSDEAVSRLTSNTANANTNVSLRLVTGGELSFVWQNTLDGVGRDEQSSSSGLSLSFIQPLLRGGGTAIALAPLRIAKINEKFNVLSLKSTLNGTISSVIFAYRNLLLQQQQIDIARLSLVRSQELLKSNKALIEAGRLARKELVQTQSSISQRELDLVAAQNAADSARLDLLNLLDIGADTKIELADKLSLGTTKIPDFEAAYEFALENQPEYLQALLQNEITQIDTRIAKNNRLWNLDASVSSNVSSEFNDGLGTSIGRLDNRPVDYVVGLQLRIPFGDISRRRDLIQAEIAEQRQKLNLAEQRESIRVAVKDQIRNLISLKRQIELSNRSAELAAEQLRIERLKLSQGKSSNFQVLNFEDQLISAQSSKARVIVSYLNALTRLDQTFGTTLETWAVPFEIQRFAVKGTKLLLENE